MTAFALRDVTMRDGLQDESPIATDDKVAVFDALVRAGVRDLELTSFVRPDRVPAMADAAELAAATTSGDVERWALVLNERGAQRALDAGHGPTAVRRERVRGPQPPQRRAHARRRPRRAGGDHRRVAGPAALEVTLSTAFGCPYDGPVSAEAVLAAAERALAAGAVGVSLADTIGTAIPSEVTSLVGAATRLAGERPVGVHLHDTRGLGIANALAAIDAGAARLDGTVGGLGGCPFAPGASGNLSLEDLVHVLEESGVDTGIDLDALIDVAHLACGLVGRPVESHLGKAGRRFQRSAPGE